jgi:hypothetical protein
MVFKFTKFNLPVTDDRKFAGLSAIYFGDASGTMKAKILAHDSKTSTLFDIADISECSATSSPLSINVEGQ